MVRNTLTPVLPCGSCFIGRHVNLRMYITIRQTILRTSVISSVIFKRFHLFHSNQNMSTSEGVGKNLTEVLSVLENFAPKQLSESWDNTGLLVQPYTPSLITKILLTNDLTEAVALEAHKNKCEMIISYHPPIFTPLKSIVQNSWKERIVSFLLENRISLYSPHTSWDSVQGGVNDWLASGFPYLEISPITPGVDPNTGAGRFLKVKPGMTLSDAVSRVKKITGLKHVRLALGNGKTLNDMVKTVALCAGSGGSVLKNAAKSELFLTGEMLHHDILDAVQRGISVILTNHSDSERGFLRGFSTQLKYKLNNQIQVLVSECDKDPLITV